MEGGGEHYSNTSMSITSSEEEEGAGEMELKRGPWTVDEDLLLINYIGVHGEGRWNSLSRSAGLRRSGKSCRLRWLNYLRPDVRRGNITLEEQLTILQLHSQWGNRWSKIAQYLPGRTDNEIKNYWRTRVQKHAKQLGCSVNSKLFKDTMRYIWMPRLMEKIQATTSNNNTSSFVASGPQEEETLHVSSSSDGASNNNLSYNADNSSMVASSDNIQISTITGLQEYTTPFQFDTPSCNNSSSGSGHHNFSEECLISPNGYFNQNGFGFQGVEQQDNLWLGNDGFWDNLWNVDQDTWFPN